MRTTLDLEEELLRELMALSRGKSKSQAVNLAIAEFVRERKLEQLKALRGRLHLEENWNELRALECEESPCAASS